MRILIPILAVLLAVIVAVSMAIKSGTTPPPTPEPGPAAETAEATPGAETPDAFEPAEPADPVERPDAPVATIEPESPTGAQPDAAPTVTPAAIEGLRAVGAAQPAAVTLGSSDAASPYRLEMKLTSYGAGVASFRLANYDVTAGSEEPYVLERYERIGIPPYAARALSINGQPVVFAFTDSQGQPQTSTWLFRGPWEVGEVETADDGTQTVSYRLQIVDVQDQPVLEIIRTWSLEPGSYDPKLRQRLINRSNQPLTVQWSHYAQGDVIDDGSAYLGDRRQFALGHFKASDPRRVLVRAVFDGRSTLLADFIAGERDIWPGQPSLDPGGRLVWLAAENRYFALITHPEVDEAVAAPADLPLMDEMFADIGMQVIPPPATPVPAEQRSIIFTLTTPEQLLQPGETASVNLGVYAGPREKTLLSQPPYDIFNFQELVRYELGCTVCTFQWLARGLLWFLEVIHYVVRDWGVAIIILVLVVRLLLHPITKRAQVNMMKMSKAMQTLQPEMEKLKKKYKDDQQKLSAETMKLYREKGVNPVNMLGCLPMFLQMPIWVALYAMLYLAIELRNQPAFYGVFQWISGGHWPFLESLSDPDRFIPILDAPATITLIFIQFDYSSINLLPLLMGVAFWVNMKFTTPPPPPNESDEQKQMRKQQQMMMKLMPFMMPLFLYAAPSGLTLYICASTFAGMLDSYMVRKHINELEEKGELFKAREAKERKPGGFMDRVMKMAEAKQREIQQRQTRKR